MKKMNISRTRLHLMAACSLMACSGAQAAITCSVSSNGFSSAYVPSNAGINITSASFTMTCTRSVTGDATTQAYTVQVDNGSNRSSAQNRAASGGNFINYDTYTDSACTTQWKGNTKLGGTITLGSDFLPHAQTVSYWGCIPAGQTTVPAGTYADTVTMNPNIGSNATFPVSIVTPSSCSVAASFGNLTFNYSSFQAVAASPSLAFTANCTSRLPYSMALDATTGTSLGLNYSLGLSASSGVGNGAAQSYTINGSMVAGQAGTCATGSCTSSTVRTLTITY
jgi:spore coat protein U-like protein